MSDEMAKVRVRVTQKDIDAPCDGPRSRNCPFARAINRVLKPGYMASVGLATFNVTNNLHTYNPWVEEPKVMQDWIAQYDNTGNVRPIRVTLPIKKNALKRFKD